MKSPGGGGSGLRDRDRRALFLGGTVAFAALFVRFAALPYVAEVQRLQDAVSVERETLARERGMLAEIERMDGAVSRLEESVGEWEGRLLPKGELEATARLSDHLTEVAEASGILLQRIDGRAPEVELTGLRPRAASVRALGDLEGMLRFLHDLESSNLLVRVDRIQLSPSGVRTADPEEARALSLTAVVRGYSFAEGLGDRPPTGAGARGEP